MFISILIIYFVIRLEKIWNFLNGWFCNLKENSVENPRYFSLLLLARLNIASKPDSNINTKMTVHPVSLLSTHDVAYGKMSIFPAALTPMLLFAPPFWITIWTMFIASRTVPMPQMINKIFSVDPIIYYFLVLVLLK